MSTVLITGANRGIGLEFVRQYAEDGDTVLACCRDPKGAGDLAALATDHSNIEVHPLDVTSDESVAALASKLKGPAIDVLINNAGVMGGKKQGLQDADLGEWKACLDANTLGPFRVMAALADNVAASDEKKMATISSFMGSIGRKGSGAFVYRSSKAAVNMVTTLVANELKDKGVIAVPMHPGWVQTDMGGKNADITTEQSVSGLREVIAGLTPDKSARFWNYNGEELPW